LATRFESLPLDAEGLFGIRLQGAFGRGDRQRLLELEQRCLDKDKTRLILDCAGLDSLGGGGAGVLADLQRQLLARGGEVVFVSVGQVIHRFLQKKFTDLPMRCFDSVSDAATALAPGSPAAATARSERSPRALGTNPAVQPAPANAPNLDALLDDVEATGVTATASARRAADLVTAVYVSLDDTLQAAGADSNPTVFGGALAMLLDSHDLSTETVYCYPRGDQFVAVEGPWRLPAEGGIVSSLIRSRRPLTLLDLEENALWDEETQLLEDMQPDLLLPLIRDDALTGIAFLRRGGDAREYGLAEIFALELLQRLLACGAQPAPRLARDPGATVVVPTGGRGPETLLGVKLELARGLQAAQDVPHFWQIFVSRLREAAEVTSLVYIDSDDPPAEPFLAGEARRGLDGATLGGERIRTFFRTLEQPVEVANMPASFAGVRDVFLTRGLQWLIALRADDQTPLGALALGLRWRCQSGDFHEAIQELTEITAEAFLRLRENQRRADLSLRLLEQMVVGESQPGQEPDRVTYETARAVRLLARELGLRPDQERDLVLGSLLRNHSQAQPGVDELAIDRLKGQEWEVFRAHPDTGERKLAVLNAPVAVRDAVRHHHERFDGRGFPLGLKGRDIPLVARLVAVAQFYALHLVANDAAAAHQALHREAGKSLDPDLVEIFSKAIQRADHSPVSV